MFNRDFDVIVVGGGPGGAIAASFLGHAGVSTLLVDLAQFPRDKSCGDAICGRSVEILQALGLDRQIEAAPVGMARGEIFSSPKGDVVHIPFSKMYAMRRMLFDDILFQHAKQYSSVTTVEGFRCTDLVWEGQQVAGIVGQHEDGTASQFRAQIVIGADGAMSKVAEKTGAYDFTKKNHDHWMGGFRMYYDGVKQLTDNLEIHFVDDCMPGYFWMFPVEDGRVNVGAGMIETDLRGLRKWRKAKKVNLRKTVYQLMATHPRFRQRFAHARELPGSFRGWLLPCGSERRKVAGNGWMLIGDAASLIDPFSGEGIANAMTSGRMAAECSVEALRCGDVSEASLQRYETKLWNLLGKEFHFSTRLQKLVRQRWLLNYLAHRAATKEKVRTMLTELVVRPEKRDELSGWRLYSKLLLE